MKGIKKLLGSAKGTLSLIIFFGSLMALFTGHLGGTPFAAVISSIQAIYTICQHRVDIASMGLPQPGGTIGK